MALLFRLLRDGMPQVLIGCLPPLYNAFLSTRVQRIFLQKFDFECGAPNAHGVPPLPIGMANVLMGCPATVWSSFIFNVVRRMRMESPHSPVV